MIFSMETIIPVFLLSRFPTLSRAFFNALTTFLWLDIFFLLANLTTVSALVVKSPVSTPIFKLRASWYWYYYLTNAHSSRQSANCRSNSTMTSAHWLWLVPRRPALRLPGQVQPLPGPD